MENTIVTIDSTQYNNLITSINDLNNQLQEMQVLNEEYFIYLSIVLLIIIFTAIIGVVKSFVRWRNSKMLYYKFFINLFSSIIYKSIKKCKGITLWKYYIHGFTKHWY